MKLSLRIAYLSVAAMMPALSLAQAQIRSGSLVYTPAVDFTTGFTPNGTGYFVSQAFVPSPPQPNVNQPYYVSVTMAGIASPSVGRLMAVHFIPPAGTSVVVDPTIPVRCFYGAMNGQGARVEFTNTVVTDNSFNANLRVFGCPQPSAGTPYQIVQLPNNNGTAFFLDRRDPQRPGQVTWPMGSQASYEFQIPVVSNRTMDGFSTPDRFYAPVRSIQGDGVDPWAYPFLSLLVSPSAGGNTADMVAGLFGAPPPPPSPNTARLVIDCKNNGPNAAQNANCGFSNIPTGLNASVVCNAVLPVPSLAVNSFIRCTLLTNSFIGTRAVTGVAGSASIDSNLTNNTQALTLNGGLSEVTFANGFE